MHGDPCVSDSVSTQPRKHRTIAAADGRRRVGFWDFKLTQGGGAAERCRSATVAEVAFEVER